MTAIPKSSQFQLFEPVLVYCKGKTDPGCARTPTKEGMPLPRIEEGGNSSAYNFLPVLTIPHLSLSVLLPMSPSPHSTYNTPSLQPGREIQGFHLPAIWCPHHLVVEQFRGFAIGGRTRHCLLGVRALAACNENLCSSSSQKNAVPVTWVTDLQYGELVGRGAEATLVVKYGLRTLLAFNELKRGG